MHSNKLAIVKFLLYVQYSRWSPSSLTIVLACYAKVGLGLMYKLYRLVLFHYELLEIIMNHEPSFPPYEDYEYNFQPYGYFGVKFLDFFAPMGKQYENRLKSIFNQHVPNSLHSLGVRRKKRF